MRKIFKWSFYRWDARAILGLKSNLTSAYGTYEQLKTLSNVPIFSKQKYAEVCMILTCTSALLTTRFTLHHTLRDTRHASSARRSRANVRFSSLYDIKLAIVTSKYSNVSLCSKRVFAHWKLEKIDSKIKEVLGKICYKRNDVWKALCYTACVTGTATQEFHSVPNFFSLFLDTPKFC